MEEITPQMRGKKMAKWRHVLGWSVGEVARRIGSSTRTVSAVESDAQVMSDARWRLFLHEVRAAVSERDAAEFVVVLAKDQSMLDVVSSDNYAGYGVSDDGATGLIASHSVSRLTGASELHRQLFPVSENHHVIEAALRWNARREDSVRFGDGGERTAAAMSEWLTRRVLKRELMNPQIIPLKAAISEAKAQLDRAIKNREPDEVRESLMRQLDRATANLMEIIAKGTDDANPAG